jgi:membrane associated rhomboid family serine protease
MAPSLPAPPRLPAALTDPKLPVWVGISAWLAGSVILGAARLIGDRPLDVWFWATVAGWALGLLGYVIMSWQRSAARRGSRSAQSGLG